MVKEVTKLPEEEIVEEEITEEEVIEEPEDNARLQALEAELAEANSDRELLNELLANEDVRRIILNDNGGNRSQEEDIDPEQDPIGAVRQMIDRSIASSTESIVESVTHRLLGELNPLISQSKQNSAKAEYDTFIATNPKASAMTFEDVAKVRATRPELSIRDAVAVTKPELLVGNAGTKRIPPTVGKSSSKTAGDNPLAVSNPTRLRSLLEGAKKSEGTRGIRGKLIDAFSK